MELTILGVILGGAIAIATTIAVEYFRRPKLRLSAIEQAVEVSYPAGKPARYGRYLALRLTNEPLPWYAKWMQRSAALQCRGTMSFHHLDGQKVFAADMPVRFAESPQPIPMEIHLGGYVGILVDPQRLSADSRVDVYPGEEVRLDVAARFDNDADCYGWSNLSYFSNPAWRNADWKLPAGRYLVKAVVSSSGEKCATLFRLLNEGTSRDFRLERALPSDTAR